MKIFTSRQVATLAIAALFLIFGTSCQNGATDKTPASSNSPAAKTSPAASSNLAPATYRGVEVKPITFPGRTFMAIRKRVAFSGIQPFYVENLGKIFTACQAQGLEMDGMPSGLFYEYDEEAGQTDMAAAIGVKAGKEVGGGIQMINIPAVKALQIDYYGPYEGIADAHYAMDDFIKSNKLRQNKRLPAIEEYVTDPSTEPDQNKWLTRLFYFY